MKKYILLLLLLFSAACASRESLLKSKDPADHFSLGKQYYVKIDLDKKNIQHAVKSFENVIRLAPKNGPQEKNVRTMVQESHNYLGQLYVRMSQTEKAISNYKAYFKKGGKAIDVKEKLAAVLFSLQKKKECKTLLKEIYRVKKDMPLTLWMLGELARQEFAFDAAARYYGALFKIPGKLQGEADLNLELLNRIKAITAAGGVEKKILYAGSITPEQALLVIARIVLGRTSDSLTRTEKLKIHTARIVTLSLQSRWLSKKLVDKRLAARMFFSIYLNKSRDIRAKSRYTAVANPFYDVSGDDKDLDKLVFSMKNNLLPVGFDSKMHPDNKVSGIDFLEAVFRLSRVNKGEKW